MRKEKEVRISYSNTTIPKERTKEKQKEINENVTQKAGFIKRHL
jgi:hypothetical protein